MIRLPSLPILLLALSAFLAPLIGGYVVTETGTAVGGGWLHSPIGSPDAPILNHALISLPMIVGYVLLLLRTTSVQVPTTRLAIAMLGFFAVVGASVAISEFRGYSLVAFLQWTMYGIAFFAAVAIAGRRDGPVWIAGAVATGCSAVAARGLLEYAAIKAVVPQHRIFGGWMNPNALAAILLVGLILALGLMLARRDLLRLLFGAFAVLIGLALLLTQSKGGLLAWGVGLVAFAVPAILWSRRGERLQRAAAVGVVLIVIAGLGMLLAAQQQATPDDPAALARITATDTQEQSAGFRRLLWQGAGRLVAERPIGYGIGTYPFESARSGLHTPTQMTHNAFLQLTVEAGPLALVFLLAAGAMWTLQMFRAARRWPSDLNALRAGIFGAVVAVAAHSFIDSDLYYFGIGFCFFLLLGLGLLVGADAVAPEFVSVSARALSIAAVVTFGAALLAFGNADLIRTRLRLAIQEGDGARASAAAAGLMRAAPMLPDGPYFAARLEPDPSRRRDLFERAVELGPTARNLRALAREQERAGDSAVAVTTLSRALQRDPHSLLTLRESMEMYARLGDVGRAEEMARRLIAVEETTYFQIRALPELVPTQTFEARLFLAERTGDDREQAWLLREAVEGYVLYARRTVGFLLSLGVAEVELPGESLPIARERLEVARQANARLVATYRRLEDEAGLRAAAEFERELVGAVAAIDEALDSSTR
jgi:O-antigen ligase